MPDRPLQTVLRQLRRFSQDAERVSDAQLLERFVNRRDEAAFELLVWRHEHLVLSVCRRVLHDLHDAEDAFQATFLALVRRGKSISKRDSLASWLYRVAYRVAVRARSRTGRREKHLGIDPPAAPGHDPADGTAWQEARRVLDEEVCRLPEKYRVPIILLYLEGKSYDEVARQLGCPRGTVSTWLTRAREVLRRRLVRRGVTLSAGSLALFLAEQGATAAPAALVGATVQAALWCAAGKATAGVLSAQVAALTKGVLQAMFLTRLKIAAVVVLTLTLAGTGVGVLTYPVLAGPKDGLTVQAPDPEPARPEKPKPAPRDADPAATDPKSKTPPRPEPPPPPDPNPTRLDEILRRWHQAVADVETAVIHLTVTHEDGIFTPTPVSAVLIKYQKPDRILFEMQQKDKPEELTRLLWTDSKLYLFVPGNKTVQAMEWPSRVKVSGFGIHDPSWVFMRGVKPEEARKRFDVKLAKEDQWYAYVEFVPLPERDGSQFFRRARVVLNKETFLPRQLWYEEPNGNTATWDVTKIETNVSLTKEDFRPEVPAGWQIYRQPGPNPDPNQTPPNRELSPPKTTGDRLEHLLDQLLESKRSDEQVFEALCLATLGRLPTDTEQKLVLGTVAKHKDRKEAFAEVLTQLTSTAEFRTHVETLGKRDLRHRPR
jgi:RNA polymerase sigma factor (sigma-70 family)